MPLRPPAPLLPGNEHCWPTSINLHLAARSGENVFHATLNQVFFISKLPNSSSIWELRLLLITRESITADLEESKTAHQSLGSKALYNQCENSSINIHLVNLAARHTSSSSSASFFLLVLGVKRLRQGITISSFKFVVSRRHLSPPLSYLCSQSRGEKCHKTSSSACSCESWMEFLTFFSRSWLEKRPRVLSTFADFDVWFKIRFHLFGSSLLKLDVSVSGCL